MYPEERKVFSVTHFEGMPIPKIGDSVEYGCHLRVVDVTYVYERDSLSRMSLDRIEVRVE